MGLLISSRIPSAADLKNMCLSLNLIKLFENVLRKQSLQELVNLKKISENKNRIIIGPVICLNSIVF